MSSPCPILKLGKTVDELTLTVRDLRQEHVAKTSVTVDETNALLATTNVQLQRVDAITSNAQTLTANAAAMSSLVAATLGGPVIRAAAFSYGVRRALAARRNGTSGSAGAGRETSVLGRRRCDRRESWSSAAQQGRRRLTPGALATASGAGSRRRSASSPTTFALGWPNATSSSGTRWAYRPTAACRPTVTRRPFEALLRRCPVRSPH